MADEQKDKPQTAQPQAHGGGFQAQQKSQADKAKDQRTGHWQKLADHSQEQMDKMSEILNDPNASPEDKQEAQETLDAMTKIQFRLKNRYNISPSGQQV